MNGQSNVVDFPGAALSEAVAWRVRLHEQGVETSLEFEVWLSSSANKLAWSRVNSVWDSIGEHSSDALVVELRQRALGDAKRARSSRRLVQRGLHAAKLVAATLVFMAVYLGAYSWFAHSMDYKTGIGERRTITLSDGSTISLDSQSEVRVRYSERSRELQLLRGQARFDVAHDVERPFSVRVRNQTVIATGTAFNIDLAGQKVLVTLIEGHVIVLDDSTRTKGRLVETRPLSIQLQAGEQLEQVASQPPLVKPANIERATSWMAGQLIFDDEPLASVIDQLNRYSLSQIVIDDRSVANMRISGVFSTGDVSQFLEVVTHYLPVHAVATDTGSYLIEKNQ